MANTEPNTTPASQTNLADLAARLVEHADRIEMVAARGMADIMRLAAREFDRLIAEIRWAAANTKDESTRRFLLGMLGEG